MAISNKLIVSFQKKEIDNFYDFYLISTSGKYIPFGARVLDLKADGLKIESIAFENGKTLFLMIKKGLISRLSLVKNLNDTTLVVRQISCTEMKEYILFRLFLYSLNNFEHKELTFNNLTGKFYIYNPEWMKKDRSSFVALGINIDSDLNLLIEAATFAKLSFFKNNKRIKDYPKYCFSEKNNSLKRVFELSDANEIYIKHGLFNKKAEIPFFTFDTKSICKNKVYFLYKVMDLLKKKYDVFLQFKFEALHINKSIKIEKDKDFMLKAINEFNSLQTNYVNLLKGSEYDIEFDNVVKSIQKKVQTKCLVSDSLLQNCNNIILIHNKEYYEQLKYPDPYKNFNRENIVQCITVEDCAEKIINDNDAIINTIIKESVIKKDIIYSHKISLDDWGSYSFCGNWIFGKERNNTHYFIIVHPNGEIEFENNINGFDSFKNEILNECSDYLTDNKGKEKTVIVSPDGDINVVSRTNRFPLPSKDLLNMDFISRDKESREKYFSGVVDINYYDVDNYSCFNVGLKGSGMNTKIIKAPLIYKIDVIKGQDVISDILSTMSVTFVKYKSYTVLPYPLKYLNEYILMNENDNIEDKSLEQ